MAKRGSMLIYWVILPSNQIGSEILMGYILRRYFALLQQTRYPARNLAIFLLSIKAELGLRRLRHSLGTWSQTQKVISRSH